MSAQAVTRRQPSSKAWVWLVLGGLVLAVVDAVFAIAFWQPRGVGAMQILQSIASGLLGRAAYDGGAATAWLGAGLHYFIATVMVLACYVVSRRFAGLLRHPIRYGLAYGMLLYAAMNLIVLPLSATGMPAFDDPSWIISSILVHMLLGVICTLAARRAMAV